MAQREREGVRYVDVERKKETRTAANNVSTSENSGQTETPRILRKLAQREQLGLKYYNPGQSDDYTVDNLRRYLDLSEDSLRRRANALNSFSDSYDAQEYVPQSSIREVNQAMSGEMDYVRTGANDARAWLYANSRNSDPNALDTLAAEIAARTENEAALRDMSAALRKYWGQFESEDAYKEALAQQAEYERLLNLDTQALEAEIAQAERQNQNASAFQNAQAISNWPDWTTNATAWIMNLFRGNAQPYHGAVSPAELYDILAQADSEARKKVPDSELAQMRLDLRNAQSVQTLAQYEKMAQEPGFAERAQEGLAMENPTWSRWRVHTADQLANPVTYARDNREKILESTNYQDSTAMFGFPMDLATYMEDDEIELYSGILARDGREAADKYFDALRPVLTERMGTGIANSISDSMLKQGLYGLVGSANESIRALGQLAQPDEPMPVSATEYALSKIGENLDETGWRVGDWNLGRTAYDLSTNLGGNVAPMAIGNLIAPGAGAVAMGVVSGAGALRDAMRQGYSYGEALPYAATSGLSEAGMGYLLGGIRQLGGVGTRHVAQRLIGKVGNRFARAGLNWGLNALGEFSEETIQSALDPVLRNWLLDENNEIKLYDEQYLYEGLLGALTSVLLGVGEFRQNLRTQDFGAGVMESGNTQALIEHAQQMGDSSEAARLAREMQSGVMPTNAQSVGELAVAYANEGGDVSFMQPQPDANAVTVGEMGDDVLSQLYAQADETAQTPEEADAWRRAVDLAYEAGRRGMPEEELSRFELSGANVPEEARMQAYYAGRADAQSEQAAREAVYEEGNTEAAAQPVQADVAQAQATDAAVPTAVQTDVAAQTAAQASQATQVSSRASDSTARRRLPDWTNTRGGLVRQDSAGENLNRQQMANLRVLNALGQKYNVVFVAQDSISDAQGNRANARYAGGRVFEVALDAQEGAYTYFATHEMAHYLKSQSADMYAALEDSVRAWADGAGIDFDARVQAAQERYARAGQELTQEQAAEEVVGDMLGTIFADPSAAQELLNNAPRSVLEKIRDFISELLDAISAAARRITGAKDLAALTELEGWAQDMAKMLDVAMSETGRANADRMTQQTGPQAESAAYSLADEGESTPGITLEDVNALRSIGRKSINAFTSEEIRATEPWARKFYRELGTKSPFFRAWFGDWRANDTTPVTLPDIDENAQIASERSVNADTKMQISWNKNFKNESAVHASKGNRTDVDILSNNIKEIVEKSVLLDTVVSESSSKSKLPGTAFMHSFYTLAKMRGKEALVKLYVEEAFSARTESTFARAYNLKYIEMIAGIDRGVYSSEGGLTDSHPATDFSVADLFALVKRFDKDFAPNPASKVVDEDGRPMVVYHGTDSDFTVFDRSKSRSKMDIQGSFFSPWEDDARGYGGNVRPFYLNLKNPADEGAAYRALRRFKGQNEAGKKAREYLEKLGYDGVNNSDEEYIAFNPEQIKSATDNVGTFDAGNPDIRYSLFDESADASQLLSENERLRRLHETFASKVGDVSRYKGKITQEAALTAARGIKRATQSKIDADALAGSLTALREEANRQGEAGRADNEFLVQIAQNIARQVLEQSAFVDESARTLDQALRRHLRGTRISLSDAQKAEARKVLGDSRAFARANMGRFVVANDGMPLSSLWNELSTMFPSLFDETTSEGDMPIALMDAFERARPEIENPYGSNEEYLMYVSYDILNRVLGLPEAKTYLEAARAEGERRGQRVGRREARAQTAQAVREARQAGRAQVQEVRAQERARADERVRSAREAAAKRAERRAETEAKARLRRSIARKANNLIARLAKPTDARHIPEAMRKSVFEALRRINYTAEAPSIRHEAWQARIANLSNQINRYQDTLAEGGMDPALVADLNALVDEIDSTTRFDDMTSKQLEVLDDVFANLTRLVNEQDRLVSTRNRERAQKVADSAIQFLAGRRERRSDRTARAVDLVTFDAMAAGDFFRTQLGEDAGGTLYQALRDGQDSTHAHMAQAAQDFAAMLKRRGIAYKDRQDWEKQIKAVKLKSGETIYARDTQLMTIYALSGREAGRRHLLGERSGVVLGRVRGTVDGRRINATQARPTRLTAEDLSTIADALSPKQRGIVDDMVEYMSSTISDWGNHASMEMYGYRKFTEDHYWPVQVDRTAVRLTNLLDENSVKMNAAKHRGFTKALNEQAANPVDIGDAFQIFGAHAVEMANYDGYAPVVDDLIKVFNSVSASAGTSLRTELSRTTAQAGEHYVRKLLEDINHASTMTSAAEGLVGKLVANYKKSAILAKPRVAVQQYTAIARALDEINANYLARGVAESAKRRGASVREMQEHAPIAWWKSHGNYDTHVGQSAINIVLGDESVRTRIDEASMALAGKADNAAWAGIWEAVKLEIAAAQPELASGTSEYWNAVRTRFNEVVDRTQVVDTVLHRAQMARSRGMASAFTAFMSEPMRTYNMMREAVTNIYRSGGRDRAAYRRAARTLGALTINATFHSLVLAAFDTLRYRDDEEEDFGSRFWENFEADLNPLGMVPVISDFVDSFATLIEGGTIWETNMMTEGPLAIVEAGTKIIWALQEAASGDARYNKRSAYGLTRDMLQGISRTFGLPVEGLVSWFELIINSVSPGTLYTQNPGKYTRLKEAVGRGDAAQARALASELVSDGTEMSSIRSTLTSEFKPKYRELYEAGDSAGMAALRSALASFYEDGEAHFSAWLED
jgi:hypothetical protein